MAALTESSLRMLANDPAFTLGRLAERLQGSPDRVLSELSVAPV